jgi:ubiquinone/menaquinone biosynthesis C-methylase UbiE
MITEAKTSNATGLSAHEYRAARADSFGDAAELYDRARPTYPDAALDWLLAGEAGEVLDLGAGTGKLTAAVIDRGLRCVAVDPSALMLAQLVRVLPDAGTRVGSAESIPLPDDSVDTVLVAQAWHWVDTELAVPEVARVLRPGGTLGLVWNVHDIRVVWVETLMRIIGEGELADVFDRVPLPGAPFGAVERRVVEWVRPINRHGLIDLVSSRSIFLLMDEGEQRATLALVNHLLDSHPSIAGREWFDLPYRTMCFRVHLP